MTKTAPRQKAVLVYNPASGKASDMDLCIGTIVHKLCEQMKLIVTVIPTERAFRHHDLTAAIDHDVSLVVAVGGDGTIRLALGALSETKSRVPVGIVPFGTGNQLARNLGIYEENLLEDPLDTALSIIVRGHTQRIDLGLMNGEYFCVAAGAGPLSDAVASPSSDDKANMQMLAYVGSLIQNFALPPVVFRIRTGADDFQVSASGIFVTNVADLGVGTLSDTAEISDGLLDLCILSPGELPDYLNLGFRFTSGFSGGPPPYYIRKIKSLELDVVPVESQLSDLQFIAHNIRSALKGDEAKPPRFESVSAMIDGDLCGSTPMRIEVVPDAVTVITPK